MLQGVSFFPFCKESLLSLLNASKGPQFHSCKISFLAAMQRSGGKEEPVGNEMSRCFKCRSCSNSRSLLEVCNFWTCPWPRLFEAQ